MADPVVITDAAGRALHLKMLTARERFKLFEAIPNELQVNAMWMGWTLAACSVRQIGDMPVVMPDTKQKIEQLVDQLGDDGIDVVQQFLVDQQAQRDEAAKNSPGTPPS